MKKIILLLSMIILLSSFVIASEDIEQALRDTEVGWTDNSPSSWDKGARFTTNFNESEDDWEYYLLSATLVTGDTGTDCDLYEADGTLLETTSVSSYVCTFINETDGIRLSNATTYRLRSSKSGTKLNKEYYVDEYPVVNNLLTFIGFCGDDNDGAGCNDAPAEGTSQIVSFKKVTIRRVPIVVADDINTTLFNSTDEDIITPVEDKLYFIRANYTLEGVSNSDGVCNWTADNISSVLYTTGSNFTLNGATKKTLIFEDSAGGSVINDTTKITVCRSGAGLNNVQMYYNGSALNNISSSVIPQCPSTHTETFVTTSLKNNESFNITIACDGCSIGQYVKLVSSTTTAGDVLIFHGRLWGQHSIEGLKWNATNLQYEEREYHTFPYPGTYDINVTCNDTFKQTSFITSDVLPIATLLSITDIDGEYVFNNQTEVESGNISILGECSNDFISFNYLNVSYTNGTLIQSNSTEYGFYDSSLLNEDLTYDVSFECIDIQGNSVIDYRQFILNDTVTPDVIWVSPSNDNTSTVITNFNLSIDLTASDTNLFSINLSCWDNLDVLKHTYYKENLPSSFQYTNTSDNLTNLGEGKCTLILKDKHTMNDISSLNIDYKRYDTEKMFSFEYQGAILNITLIEEYDDLTISKEKSKYTFEPEFNTFPSELNYIIECNQNLFYWDDKLIDDKKGLYGHYFGCGDFWIDFIIDGIEYNKYKISNLFNESYRINIKLPKDKINLKTKSIGIKNTLNQDVSFTVIAESTGLTEISTELMILLIFLGGLWLGILSLALILPFFMLMILDGIFGIFIGFSITRLDIAFNTTFGFIFIILNVMIVILGFLMIKKS